MAQQLSDSGKEKRRQLAMKEQLKIAREISKSNLGREVRVLVEKAANAEQLPSATISSWEHGLVRLENGSAKNRPGQGKKYFVARGEADAPDIDGRIYIRGQVPVGQFCRVKIIGNTDYDLIAEPA
jgi:ribosomal protein S12 methylthiotransferase